MKNINLTFCVNRAMTFALTAALPLIHSPRDSTPGLASQLVRLWSVCSGYHISLIVVRRMLDLRLLCPMLMAMFAIVAAAVAVAAGIIIVNFYAKYVLLYGRETHAEHERRQQHRQSKKWRHFEQLLSRGDVAFVPKNGQAHAQLQHNQGVAQPTTAPPDPVSAHLPSNANEE